MAKPKTLMALKQAYREWPAALGYPMLMAGLELVLKSALRYPGARPNYLISLDGIHADMRGLVGDAELPAEFRFGHQGLEGARPSSDREEVLAIGLYNALRFGQRDPEEGCDLGGLGALSLLDYQVPVVRGKAHGIGCIDLLGVVPLADGPRYRPVLIELKGQGRDDDRTRRDCPHFGLLEAWIYLVLFARSADRYAAQASGPGDYRFAAAEIEQIDWARPIVALIAPDGYWAYWERSDTSRGYDGLSHFSRCCGLMAAAYRRSEGLGIQALDVVGLSMRALESSQGPNVERCDIHALPERFERVTPPVDEEELASELADAVRLPWASSAEQEGGHSASSAGALPPSRFKSAERQRQAEFKKSSPYFSVEAKAPGAHGDRTADYCLPDEYAAENLYEEIRDEAVAFFAEHGISWHSLGWKHLLSSQAFCVNFLFPFARRPEALRAMLATAFPRIVEPLPIEDGLFVTWEWNGGSNYLNEHGYGARGEYATYPDAAVKFRTDDGVVQIALIEWKYTETYAEDDKARGGSGAVRMRTYRPFCQAADCPLRLQAITDSVDAAMEALFYEPFYQLLREQLLAMEIEKDPAHGVGLASVMHVCPERNHAFHRGVTSPKLRERFPRQQVLQVWQKLLAKPTRFVSASPELLFRAFPVGRHRELASWAAYMSARYPWLSG